MNQFLAVVVNNGANASALLAAVISRIDWTSARRESMMLPLARKAAEQRRWLRF